MSRSAGGLVEIDTFGVNGFDDGNLFSMFLLNISGTDTKGNDDENESVQ